MPVISSNSGTSGFSASDKLVRDKQDVDGIAFLLFPVEFLGNGGG